MKCPHCGAELPEGFIYIPPAAEEETNTDETDNFRETDIAAASGALPAEESAPLAAAGQYFAPRTAPYRAEVKRLRIMGMAAAAVIVILGVIIGLNMYGTSSLKSRMSGTWASAGSMTTGKLTVTQDTIAYSETFGFVELNGQTAPYKAVSKDTIEIGGIKHRISFDSSYTTMTITPGITTNGPEIWYSTAAPNIQNQNSSAPEDGAPGDGVL